MLNTARRMVYPFAPELARGLGVPLTAVTSLIAVNQATAVLGPLGALFADRVGNKPVLLLAVALCFIGCAGIALFPVYGVVLAGLFLAGLAKSLFDPSLQAQIASQVPYAQRGRFIGFTEISWAGATLLTIPAAGVIMSHFSWQAPFKIVAILTIACFFLLLKLAPARQPDKKTERVRVDWKVLLQNKKVAGLLIFVFFMSLANDNVFVIYGVWLESACGLSLAQIGMSTVLIGMAEFLAEGSSALFSDRIGLKKSVLTGTAATAVIYLVLPFTASGIVLILSGLFALFLSFEFTVVSSMSLGTELVPESRAATMAAFFAVGGIGRIIGAFSGGLIWSAYGIRGICLVSGFCSVLALAALGIGTRIANKALD
nr:MFS transporter [uncultured Desulfobacter sp.]